MWCSFCFNSNTLRNSAERHCSQHSSWNIFPLVLLSEMIVSLCGDSSAFFPHTASHPKCYLTSWVSVFSSEQAVANSKAYSSVSWFSNHQKTLHGNYTDDPWHPLPNANNDCPPPRIYHCSFFGPRHIFPTVYICEPRPSLFCCLLFYLLSFLPKGLSNVDTPKMVWYISLHSIGVVRWHLPGGVPGGCMCLGKLIKFMFNM